MTLIKPNTSNRFTAVHTYKASDVQLLNAHGLEEAAKALVTVNHAAVKQSRLAEALNSLCDELYEAMSNRNLDIPAYNGGDNVEEASLYVSKLYDQLKRALLKTGVQYYTAGTYISSVTLSNDVISILERRGNDWTIQSLTELESVLRGAKEGIASNQQVISACVSLAQSYEIETMKFVACDSIYNVHDGDEVGRYAERVLHDLHNLIVG